MVESALLQTFIVNGSISILWFFFAFSILKRGSSKRSNQMFFTFLALIAIGLLVNVLYRIINLDFWNIWLNKTTIFLSSFAIVFLLIFNLIILKSEKVITDRIKIGIIIVWFILCLVLFFIPNGVSFDYSAGKYGLPVWSAAFSIYGLIIDQALFSIVLYVVSQIYKRFQDKSLKRKYISIILSIAIFDWILVGNFIFNWLNNPLGRTIFLITSILALPAGILLYLGVRREA